MNIEILIDGSPLVKAELDLPTFLHLIREAVQQRTQDFRSTPASEIQIKELLSRIDHRSVEYLKVIAASENGSVTWQKMREIFGIKEEGNWNAYSGSFGKGITRAYRKIVDVPLAKLIWWKEEDWNEHDWDEDECCVYIDGPALTALRAVTR